MTEFHVFDQRILVLLRSPLGTGAEVIIIRDFIGMAATDFFEFFHGRFEALAQLTEDSCRLWSNLIFVPEYVAPHPTRQQHSDIRYEILWLEEHSEHFQVIRKFVSYLMFISTQCCRPVS